MTEKDLITQIQSIVGVETDGIWGTKTRAAVAKALDCTNSVKGIQKAVGTTADGVIGPKTLEAILTSLGRPAEKPVSKPSGKTIIVLDPGHTNDFAREHPSQFASGLWDSGLGKEVASKLGFNSKTNDSVEHMLNVKIANAVAAHLKDYTVDIFDKPSMSNNSEITAVYNHVNSVKPAAFVSIHNNAAGTSEALAKKCACTASGTVSFYAGPKSKQLAQNISLNLVNLRKQERGPHNRAESVIYKAYTVISKVSSSIPSCLVEVGFYDNMTDLHWMATHIDQVGKAIAEAIIKSI